jgi:hypothetical protein
VEGAQVGHLFPVFASFLATRILSTPARLLLSIFGVYQVE